MQGWLRLFQITVKPKVSLVKPVKQLKASTFWSDSEPLGKRQYKTMEARSRTLRHSWAWQPDDVDGTETILTMHTFALSQTGIQSCCWASEALLQILHGNGMELSGNVATHRQKYFGTTKPDTEPNWAICFSSTWRIVKIPPSRENGKLCAMNRIMVRLDVGSI